MSFKPRLFTFLNYFYKKIFNEDINLNIKFFLKNISYITSGNMIAVLFSVIFSIVVANVFGPFNYGKLTLIVSIASFLQIPMLLGINSATIKYNSSQNERSVNNSIISTSLFLFLIFILLSNLFYLSFSAEISKLFSISQQLFYSSILLAIIISFFTISNTFLLSLNQIKRYSFSYIICNGVMLSIIILFIFYGLKSFNSLIWSVYIGYGVVAIFTFMFYLRKYVKITFSKKWAVTLIKYSNYGMIGGISSVVYTNIDNIFVGKFLHFTTLGIYNAYYNTSIGLIALLSGISTVIFITASKYDNKSNFFRKINKIIPYFAILIFPLIIFAQFLMFKLYGPQYNFDLKMSILFSLASIIVFIDGIYGWLMNSTGLNGIKVTALGALCIAISSIILNFLLVPLLGIIGAVISIIFSYSLSIIIILSQKKYFFKNEEVLQS